MQMSESEAREVMSLAIGRIFRMGARPEQEGDAATYEACRTLILDAADALGRSSSPTLVSHHRPGWNFGNLCVD